MKHARTRWAMIGLGLQAGRLARAMQNAKDHELVAVFSNTPEHAREFAAEWGAVPHQSLDTLFADSGIDAVCIASPNHLHTEQVLAAARAGKHILCEKPLTLSLSEARVIARAVKKSGKQFFVDYHLRMHPEALEAKRILSQKKLGDLSHVEMHWSIGGLAQKKLPPLPVHMRWRENPEQAGGGALMARGVHLFDLLRFITGQEVRETRAWSDATRSMVDRTAIGVFILDGGAPALITTSKAIPGADNRIMIYGTKGRLELRNIFADDVQPLYVKVFDSFSDALRGKKTPLATLDDGIAAVMMTEAFLSSAKQ